eukprot:1488751-Ditylum_brightwellii.AAC.1
MANTSKHHKGSNSTWTALEADRDHMQYSKQELNTIVCKSIKAAFKKACCKPCKQQEANVINQFDALSISSDGNSSDNNRTQKRGHNTDENINKLDGMINV